MLTTTTIVLLLILTAFIVGILSALFGIGGGVILIPALLFLFPNLTPQELIGTSFGMILLNALINFRTFWRKGHRLNQKILWSLGSGIALGVPFGAALSSSLETEQFQQIFGAFLLLIAIKNQFFTPEVNPDKPFPSFWLMLFFGSQIGIVAGLTGIGGGSMILPALMMLTPLPLWALSFHSQALMLFAAIPALPSLILLNQDMETTASVVLAPLNALSTGPIHWGLVLIFAIGPLAGSPIGLKLASKITPNQLKLLFSLLLTGIGFRFIFS